MEDVNDDPFKNIIPINTNNKNKPELRRSNRLTMKKWLNNKKKEQAIPFPNPNR